MFNLYLSLLLNGALLSGAGSSGGWYLDEYSAIFQAQDSCHQDLVNQCFKLNSEVLYGEQFSDAKCNVKIDNYREFDCQVSCVAECLNPKGH